MNKILMVIGSLFLTLLIMLIPVCCTLAFVYNWDDGVKFLITLLTFGFGISLWILIYKEADE